MKILAYAASSSKTSINKKLVSYAASLVEGAQVEVLDLNDFEMPLFSVDREKEIGHPELAKTFLTKIESDDAVLVSFAEHNGSFTAAYKNLFDWASRVNPKFYQNKPMIMMATSPGGRGGATVLSAATSSAPHLGADLRGQFLFPRFGDNFDSEKGEITNQDKRNELIEVLAALAS